MTCFTFINGWKYEIRSHKMCGQNFKTIFQKFEKSPWEHHISKNTSNFWNKLWYFQSCNYKIFMKSTMFQKSFYTFKALKKNIWTCGFFISNFFFSLSNVHQSISIFLWTSIYSTKRDPCVQNIQKLKIHICF
jgi:hypothetical protein